MKITVEIADALLHAAERLAVRERTTVQALMQEGLRRVLKERGGLTETFTLRRVTFAGNGLSPEFREGSWERVRDEAYRSHRS